MDVNKTFKMFKVHVYNVWYLSKKVAKHTQILRKGSRYSRTNIREVHEMRTTTVAVRIRIGIYTVHELYDNIVAMGLRFCLHEVVSKNHDQFATFFGQVPYMYSICIIDCW